MGPTTRLLNSPDREVGSEESPVHTNTPRTSERDSRRTFKKQQQVRGRPVGHLLRDEFSTLSTSGSTR